MIVTNDLQNKTTTDSASQVSHPSHYNQGGVECIDALDACGFGLDFCVGSALKYLWRFKEKGNPIQDLEKARWYIDHAVQCLNNGIYGIKKEISA